MEVLDNGFYSESLAGLLTEEIRQHYIKYFEMGQHEVTKKNEDGVWKRRSVCLSGQEFVETARYCVYCESQPLKCKSTKLCSAT